MPVATVSASRNAKEILVTFNKSMNATDVANKLGNGAVKDETLAAVTKGSATVVPDIDNTQFTIAIAPSIKFFENKDSRGIVR